MQLTLELPDSACHTLRRSPAELPHELRVAAALKWYEAEMVSQSRAAELAGLSRADFLLAAGRYGVSAVQMTSAELEEELARE
jgi:predicted HTH domain antitoxin